MIQMINKEFTLARLSTLWSLARSDAQKKLLERAMQVVDQTQAEDVMPVVHGKWIKLSEAPEWDQRRCSVCGEICCCQGNYCMHCNARMEGEVTDGT